MTFKIETLSLVLGVALLCGCVAPPHYTEYGVKGGSYAYGYTEKQADDGTYILISTYPEPSMAKQYWNQRATELCGSVDYAATIFREDRPVIGFHHYGDGGRIGNYEIEGFLKCEAVNSEDEAEILPNDASANEADS